MNYPLASLALLTLPYSLAASVHAQVSIGGISTQAQKPIQRLASRAFTVDPNGTSADFQSLGVAVAAVPSGSLLFLKSGVHVGLVDVQSKSLRIEVESVGATWLADKLTIHTVGASQEVSVSGLAFLDGFEVVGCEGDVGFTNCTSAPEGDAAVEAGLPFQHFRICGIGSCLNTVRACDSVTFVDCTFLGRSGVFDGWDGTPGEHGLRANTSSVSLYNCELRGGNGGSSNALHGFPGAGGDGVQLGGANMELRSCDTTFAAGIGGYSQSWAEYGCDGELVRIGPGATHEECAIEHVTFSMPSLVRTGVTPFYEITAPPGTLFGLMLSSRSDYQMFPASHGVLHLGLPRSIFPLGAMPATGSFSRTFPSPSPGWSGGFGYVKVQAYAWINGDERYSEPRSHVVVSPSL